MRSAKIHMMTVRIFGDSALDQRWQAAATFAEWPDGMLE